MPDFLANCGGLIHVSREWYGERGPREDELHRARDGAPRRAPSPTPRREGSTPIEVAERQALERVEAADA